MHWVLIFLRGIMMGAADIVPGVSGGTIAFITGIYERLLSSINSVLPALRKLLQHRSIQQFFQEIDALFLLILLSGILSSIFLLASFISEVIVSHPIPLWSFFCGLIAASVWIMGSSMDRWRGSECIALVLGVGLAMFIASGRFFSLEFNLLGAFISGFIAIFAMLLPGVSGSFLLLLLGTYTFILGSVKSFELSVLACFVLGCLLGLILGARIIAHLLHLYRTICLSFLTGLMLGSIQKIWPWREVLSYRLNSKGENVAHLEGVLWPADYAQLVGDPQIGLAAIWFVVGVGSILLILVVINRLERNAN
ncbi:MULTISPECIES: DUF368 domain-containing protein [unclassified Oleiphilus]|nr:MULTISPECIES: DUF368 domain-containing protein [unclassified Oleiphilus]KZY61826.1 hypothetical protein A3738_13485 [Oleiphilus sp. HI0066]KZY69977.1 hypothetical protein A3739_07530 [Oleiphilus sp. HI0067]MCH2157955.1 DUF368 domain-containing protein [Oleiphilaceae bacterium]